jgi:drug/metabolite transporter, DME family
VAPDRAQINARLQVLLAALLFSTGGAVIKATSLGGFPIACFRSGVAVLAVLAMLPGTRRLPNRAVSVVAIAYAATLVSFVLATKLTTAANAIFLQATAPLYVVVLGPWLLREPVTRRDIAFLAVLAVSLLLIFTGSEPPQATAPDPLAGNLIAVGSGVFWAFTMVGLRHLGKGEAAGGPGAAHAVVVGNLFACAATLPFALSVGAVPGRDVVAILYLGVVQIGVAYACLTAALRHVGAMAATLLLFVEPVLNPVWAWLVHGERPAPAALAGGVLILAVTFLKTALDLRPLRAARD